MAVAASGLFTASAINPPSNTNIPQESDSSETKAIIPVVTTETETKDEPIPFQERTVETDELAKGMSQIQTLGVDGVKTITYTITLTDGVETNRTTSEVITRQPIDEVTLIGTYVEPEPSCDPNYSGCVPIASDVDCASGSGNGPAYTSGPVEVIGSDIYGLDRDGDGWGCE